MPSDPFVRQAQAFFWRGHTPRIGVKASTPLAILIDANPSALDCHPSKLAKLAGGVPTWCITWWCWWRLVW